MIRIAIAGAALAAAGCKPSTPAPSSGLEAVDLGPGHRGLSGLARDDGGMLWAVSERGRVLVQFAADGSGQREVAIRGIADGVDLESLAWLGGARFAAGTESRGGDSGEAIVILSVSGDSASITGRIEIDYKELGIEAVSNEGIEGLCAAGDVMLAAFETPIESGGQRLARLVRIDQNSGDRAPLSLALTSDTGKIAGLDCRAAGGDLEVLAVERHFEVARVLRFTAAADAAADRPIKPAIAADITDKRRESDNHEGVVFGPDNDALLILDNDYGKVTGPTELQRARLD